jgi:glycerol-3-phosphate acyltransferase PlsY
MLQHLNLPLACLIAYLFGSLSSAVIVCKLLGFSDPRTQGSHNPGATNVLRLGGKKAALLTLAGDLLKGLLPVLVAKHLGFTPFALTLIALSAFLGHLFPIFFRFQGGKGVATLLGVSFALAWPLGLALTLTWLGVALTFRYSSLAALIMSLCTPFYSWYFLGPNPALIMTLISLILIIRHHQNIKKLAQGREGKIGKK